MHKSIPHVISNVNFFQGSLGLLKELDNTFSSHIGQEIDIECLCRNVFLFKVDFVYDCVDCNVAALCDCQAKGSEYDIDKNRITIAVRLAMIVSEFDLVKRSRLE